MKCILCFLPLLAISYFVIGQDLDQDSTIQHEFGLDLDFINVFLPLDNNIGRRGSYQFYYRRYRPNKKILRMGLDVDFNGSFNRNQTDLDRSINTHSTGQKKEIARGLHIFG